MALWNHYKGTVTGIKTVIGIKTVAGTMRPCWYVARYVVSSGRVARVTIYRKAINHVPKKGPTQELTVSRAKLVKK